MIQRFAAHANIGEAWGADEAEGSRALRIFLADFNALQNDEGGIQAIPMNLCQKILMAYYEKEAEDLMSTIEALFMTMRGHIDGAQSLLDPTVDDSAACALGSYVNLLKAVASMVNIGHSDLFNVEITNCAVPETAQPVDQRQIDRARRDEHRREQAAHHAGTTERSLGRQMSETPKLDEEEHEHQGVHRQRSSRDRHSREDF